MNDDVGFFFYLNTLANLCQIYDLDLNLNQISNDALMKHLLEQDKILNEQTEVYLKKIVEQNEVIIKQNEEILKVCYNLLKR